MRSRAFPAAVALLMALALLRCGGASNEPDTQPRPIEGPLYFVGTITTLASVAGETTDVPICGLVDAPNPTPPPDTIQIPGFTGSHPPGTVFPFASVLLSEGFLPATDPDRLSFAISGTDPTTHIVVTLETTPDFSQEDLGVHEGPASPPYATPSGGFRAEVILDTVCGLTGEEVVFEDDGDGTAFGSADALHYEEYTLISYADNPRFLERTAFGGCVHAVLQNTFKTDPNDPASPEAHSRVCLQGCFRVAANIPPIVLPGSSFTLDSTVTTCSATTCAACP